MAASSQKRNRSTDSAAAENPQGTGKKGTFKMGEVPKQIADAEQELQAAREAMKAAQEKSSTTEQGQGEEIVAEPPVESDELKLTAVV